MSSVKNIAQMAKKKHTLDDVTHSKGERNWGHVTNRSVIAL